MADDPEFPEAPDPANELASNQPAIDPRDFRNALGTYATGVTIITAADAGPHPERCRLQMRHGVGDDGKAGRQFGDINAHPATPCFAARLTDRTNRSTST